MEIKDLKFLAKGKRSKVYIGFLKNKKVAVKVSKRAEIEEKWLRLLNKKKMGPKLIKVEKDKLIYEFVEGKRIGDCLKDKNIKIILRKVLLQKINFLLMILGLLLIAKIVMVGIGRKKIYFMLLEMQKEEL